MNQNDRYSEVPQAESMTYELRDEDLNNVAGGNDQRVPGLSCPRCGSFIPTSIQALLTSNFLDCPLCNLTLGLDCQLSLRALEALKKVELAQKLLDE